jgi:hypothetical protein
MARFVVRFFIRGASLHDVIFDILQSEMEQRGCVLTRCHLDVVSFAYEADCTLEEAFAMAEEASTGLERRVRVLVLSEDRSRWKFRS